MRNQAFTFLLRRAPSSSSPSTGSTERFARRFGIVFSIVVSVCRSAWLSRNDARYSKQVRQPQPRRGFPLALNGEVSALEIR
jgi:hypothetical protein